MIFSSIKEALNNLKQNKTSSVELARYYLEKAKKSKTNSYVRLVEDVAIELASISDQKIKSNQAGIIEGIPYGAKDAFCTNGIKTTSCSKILENFIPNYESTVTQNIKNHGGILIGKCNMDEFAMGSTTTNSFFGPTINYHRDARFPEKDLVPGGSSGGSAVAVAEDLCLFSLGTDTGGSIRQPAAFCGVVGIKPSYGLCSRSGMIAYASSLDQAGAFTKNVEDAGLIMDAICSYDKLDSTSVPNKFRRFSSFNEKISNGVKGLKIGVPKEYYVDGIHPDIKERCNKVLKNLEENGAEIVNISLPHSELGIAVYYIITTAEASSNLARFDGIRYGFSDRNNGYSLADIYKNTRSSGFGEEVKRRICLGTFVLSSGRYEEYYIKAQKIRRMIKNDFDAAFQKIDAIVCPVTPNLPFPINEKPSDPITVYLNDILTVGANLSGLPCISVPVGKSLQEKLPIGIQVISNQFHDDTMIQVANQIEKGNW